MKRIFKVFAVAVALAMLGSMVASAVDLQAPVSQLGRVVMPLYAGQAIDAGFVGVWNSPTELIVQVETDEWLISEVQIYVGTDPVPTKNGDPVPGKFPYKDEPV
ncbi:MAG: hypothetical protein ACK2UA_17445, partial [Anaerolineae bacterium]